MREPKFETLIKIADMFAVTTDELLGRDTGEPPPLEALATQFNMSALEQEIVKGYLELPEDMRDDLMDFLERAVNKVMEESKPKPLPMPKPEEDEPSLMISRSADDRPPELKKLTPEQRKRLREAPDETQNPDNDL